MNENDGRVAGSDGKKPTVKLFDHEFGKKKVVMAGLGGLLALALAGGGIACAVSQRPQGGEEPRPVVQAEKEDEAEAGQVVQLGAKADGWEKGKSSPVIAHIVNEDEGIDLYHAYDANATEALPVPAEGGYEVSFIAPVNADGSTYKVPDTGKAESEADGRDETAGLPYTFEPIKADDVKAEDIAGILSAVNEAVKKGDETLTGENGVKAVELVERNLEAAPSADKEKAEEQGDGAVEVAQIIDDGGQEPSGKEAASNAASKPASNGSAGSSGKSSGGGSSNSKPSQSSDSSSNGGGSDSKPAHTHNWVAQTTTVHHDAEYKTVHHDAVTETRAVCNAPGCGKTFATSAEAVAHAKETVLAGDNRHTYSVKPVVVQDAWDEQVLVSGAWDETVTTGYKCSGCGATK